MGMPEVAKKKDKHEEEERGGPGRKGTRVSGLTEDPAEREKDRERGRDPSGEILLSGEVEELSEAGETTGSQRSAT